MTSPRLLFFASFVLLLLWLGQPGCFGQDVVGYTAVLQSTNSSEIDGYSLTETSYAVADYYDAGVIGYLFDGSSQIAAQAATGYVAANAYPGTSSVHRGDTYTLYSEHYLIAYYTSGSGYYNPYEYYPGAGFSPGEGYPPGYSFSSGGGPPVVQQQNIYLGYTYLQFATAPPRVSSVSPKSVVRGTSGSFFLQGSSLQDDFGIFTVRALDGDNLSVEWSGQSSASLSYTVAANATEGTHRFTVSNTWGETEPLSFKVVSGWPVSPCGVSSSPTSKYTSIAPTGTTGGMGTMTVSFSGAAYSTVSQTVSYGPSSTPSSIASNIAALITANYTQFGLTARAFGPNVVYSGNTAVGTVNHAVTGSSFATTTSSTAEAAAGAACVAAPPTPTPVCGTENPNYVLAVTNDTVKWIDSGMNHGRNVKYSLEYFPTSTNKLGQPATFLSTVTEHLSNAMAYGLSSPGPAGSGEFDDILGSTAANQPPNYTFVTDRCFSVTSPTLGNLGHVKSYDAAGMHKLDNIKIHPATKTSILNNWTNTDGSPKDISIP